VADYPLVEAIRQNVVKHPVLPDAPSRAKLQERQSAKYTEKYTDYIHLGLIEWRKAYAEWCADINRVQADVAYDFVYVDEESFEKYKPTSFRQLLEAFKEYKEKI
jgi:hypothetical protein